MSRLGPSRLAIRSLSTPPSGSFARDAKTFHHKCRKVLKFIRHEMIKSRTMTATSSRKYSWSDLCGHGAFVCLALSYLESDFLSLRLYAMSGISLSVVFQYYREKPLWIPIRWNTLFFFINAVMAGMLMMEYQAAHDIPEDQRELFDLFSSQGMKPVEYQKLMALAKRQTYNKGDHIVQLGEKHSQLHLVGQGRLSVRVNDEVVGVTQKNQFVGARSFLAWESKATASSSQKSGGSVSLIAQQSEIMHKLRRKLSQIWQSVTSLTQNSLASVNTTVSHASLSYGIDTTIILPSPFLDTVSGKGEQTSVTSSSTTDKPSLASVVVKMSPQEEEDPAGSERGYADVTCDEPCVLYSWSFRELSECLSQDHRLALSLGKCISHDLNNKMTRTISRSSLQRYRQLVSCMVDEGELTDKDLRVIRKYQLELRITDAENDLVMREFGVRCGDGTTDNNSTTNVSGSDIRSVKYLQLLGEHIGNGENVISLLSKWRLRQFRIENGVDEVEHKKCLEKLQWTSEEFDRGRRWTDVDMPTDSLGFPFITAVLNGMTSVSSSLSAAVFTAGHAPPPPSSDSQSILDTEANNVTVAKK